MALYEYLCPIHGKFEKIMPMNSQIALCEKPVGDAKDTKCGETCPRIEWSIPARRNPAHGEGE